MGRFLKFMITIFIAVFFWEVVDFYRGYLSEVYYCYELFEITDDTDFCRSHEGELTNTLIDNIGTKSVRDKIAVVMSGIDIIRYFSYFVFFVIFLIFYFIIRRFK